MQYRWNKLHFCTSEVMHAGSGKRVDLALEDRLTRDNPSGPVIARSERPFRVMNGHGSRKTTDQSGQHPLHDVMR
jgi:hypothetical protein